ncbi:MAG TPA: LPS assembly lipoprotein LptE [Thermoanaerobaculia bacterium]|jgi:outer membrane lipopolysaccharide assembly protein LptE/RlpB|nr:LPS assembly lipoprotein LptE [Thermoanaerobaculia bacterium]
MRRRLLSGALGALLLALAASLGGCGYALVGRGSTVPADIRSVYLQPLENRTQRSQVEQALTRAIAEELVTRQRFAVVGSEGEANAEILGAVTGFGVTPVTFDPGGRATEYEISITAQITFKRVGETGQVLWKSDRYTFRENYPVDPSAAEYFDREDEAIETASQRFAETLVTNLLEGF